jgi:DNA-binding transcriptional MerR regulator
MRISELSRTTGLTVATIKFYLRQQLMPPGTPVTATQSEYGQAHVDRLRLIRALVDVGGLPLTSVKTILHSLEQTTDAGDGPAGDAAADLGQVVSDVYESLPPVYPPTDKPPQRALATMKWLEWGVEPGSAALRQLEEALSALESLGLTPTPAILQRYADVAEQVARAEVSGVPADSPTEALRYVVVGTVMYEPVLIALRRLAHQHLFNERATRPPRR